MTKRKNCVHRFIQARWRGEKLRWRVYCRDCGKWQRHVHVDAPLSATGGTIAFTQDFTVP